MQGQGGGALSGSVAVHWVCWPWGFPGGAGQGAPSCVLPGDTLHDYKTTEMAATCAGLRDCQTEPNSASRLAAASAQPGAT